MKLRELKIEDAPLMLEWMHDDNVVMNLSSGFKSKTVDDCRRFIDSSHNDKNNIHLAIVSDSDEYMGTVSLKHINYVDKYAEFAIAVRSKAMGKGYSWYGMSEIIKKAFDEVGLERVLWCVSLDNKKACRFYDKHKFTVANNIEVELMNHYQNVKNLKWYVVNKTDNYFKKSLTDSNLFRLVKIRTVEAESGYGQLSFVEGKNDIPFEVKRLYFINKVNEGIRRGFHAHKNLKQLIFCPYGEINLVLDDGYTREEILLNDPKIGVLIEKPIWREMVWIQSNSVLCVLASDYYKVDDYIRDYNEFLKFIGK